MNEFTGLHSRLAGRPWVVTILGLLAILAVATYLRLWDLRELPPPLHVDEAAQGLNALELMDGKRSLAEFGWTHHLNTAFLPSGVVLKLFGPTVWNLRITEAAFGVAAVLLTYLLGRSMFSWRVGMVAAVLMSFNHFAVAFSRIGLVNQQSMTVELLAFFLLWEGFKRRRRLLVFLGGVTAGAGLYLYFGGWVVPVILGMFPLWVVVFHRRWIRSTWRLALWGVLGFVVAVLPWLSFPILKPEEFRSRPTEVFILSDLDRYKAGWETDSTLEVLGLQAYHTFKLFFLGGDSSNQYGYDAPFLDPASRLLFVIGIGVALLFLRQAPHAFLLLWFGLTLVIGGVLTDTPPFAPRLVGLFPAIMLLTALGLVRVLELLARGVPGWLLPLRKWRLTDQLKRHLLVPLLLAALAITALSSFQWHYRAYFVDYPVAPYAVYWPWIEPMSAVGRYLATQEEGTRAYLFHTPGVFAAHHGIRFYLYGRDLTIEDVDCAIVPCAIPRPDDGRGAVYIFLPETREVMGQVKQELPGGTVVSFPGRVGLDRAPSELFVAYEVPGAG